MELYVGILSELFESFGWLCEGVFGEVVGSGRMNVVKFKIE